MSVDAIKKPKVAGWYRWIPTDDYGPYNRDAKKEIVGMVFRSPRRLGGHWCFFGNVIYQDDDGRNWGHSFSMSLRRFVGHGDFYSLKQPVAKNET